MASYDQLKRLIDQQAEDQQALRNAVGELTSVAKVGAALIAKALFDVADVKPTSEDEELIDLAIRRGWP